MRMRNLVRYVVNGMASLLRSVVNRMTDPVRGMADGVVMNGVAMRSAVRPAHTLAMAVAGAPRVRAATHAMVTHRRVVVSGHRLGSGGGGGLRRSRSRHWRGGWSCLRSGDCGAGERGKGKSEQSFTNIHGRSSGKSEFTSDIDIARRWEQRCALGLRSRLAET